MNIVYRDKYAELYCGDCRAVIFSLPENSVDAIVTDPPYELSQDGKASPNGVFSEFMFPDYTNRNSQLLSEDDLFLFIKQILLLGCVGVIPGVSSSVPIGSVTLNKQSLLREIDVEDSGKLTTVVAKDYGTSNCDAKSQEGVSYLQFKLADPTQLFHVLNDVGTAFDSGRVGVGFRITPSSLPSLFASSRIVRRVFDDVGLCTDSFSELISALSRAEDDTVFGLDLGGAFVNNGSALSALILLAIFDRAGTQFVRTQPGAGGLPTKFKSAEFRFVNPTTNGTFAFNCVVHPLSISSFGFMGKEWDGSKIAYDVSVWKQCLRVLKPGGHLLSFGGSRTYHRMACAIEDAGFEIRDMINWVYGSGFPKSMDIAKAMDKSVGATRTEVIGVRHRNVKPFNDENGWNSNNTQGDYQYKAPASDAAKQWDGWGTALKPAHEPIVLARKPFSEKTVVDNVLKWGTGGLNINRCRVGIDSNDPNKRRATGENGGADSMFGVGNSRRPATLTDGRFPANLIHDGSGEVVSLFPRTKSGTGAVKKATAAGHQGDVYGTENRLVGTPNIEYGDEGSASRFFYCAKAAKSERNDGNGSSGNDHTTVKPIALMEYLIKLVTPPKGIVCDPFSGSGSTLVAAYRLGFRSIGIDLDKHYCEIATNRLASAAAEKSAKGEY